MHIADQLRVLQQHFRRPQAVGQIAAAASSSVAMAPSSSTKGWAASRAVNGLVCDMLGLLSHIP
jgi:hypothetical protein